MGDQPVPLEKRAGFPWLSAVKLAWISLVLVALALFAKRIPALIDFTSISWLHLAGATVCVVIAHFSVSAIREITTRGLDQPLSYLQNCAIFNGSNLSKYLPIPAFNIVIMSWLLKRAGLSSLNVGRSILLGVFWTATSALLIGVVVTYWLFPGHLSYLAFIFIAAWCVLVWARPERLIKIDIEYSRLYLMGMQVLLWAGYGLAFSLTVQGFLGGDFSLRAALAYVLSYGVGLLAIFAPAGAGVREGVTVLALDGTMLAEQILAVTIMMRVVIFAGDIIFAGLILLVTGKVKRS